MDLIVKLRAYSNAAGVQDACNISGVILAFASAMKVVNEECRSQGEEAKRIHPIVLLFVSKLSSMVPKADNINDYGRALTTCNEATNQLKEIPADAGE